MMTMHDQIQEDALKQQIGTIVGVATRFQTTVMELTEAERQDALEKLNVALPLGVTLTVSES